MIHLDRTPGDKRVACGLLGVDVSLCWARWMGVHEVGHAFAGLPLPDWCPACILAIHATRREVSTGQATLLVL